MMAPKPAPVKVPIPAPFSLVVSGSEQPRKNVVKEMTKIVVRMLFISRSLTSI
jgi:hypothetical protein